MQFNISISGPLTDVTVLTQDMLALQVSAQRMPCGRGGAELDAVRLVHRGHGWGAYSRA